MTWKPIKLEQKFYANAPEQILRGGQAALENAYVNEMKGHSRFPGLTTFATLGGAAPVYLGDWRDNLIAVCNGQVYRIDNAANTENVTSVAVAGGRRVTFTHTPEWLVMAAGRKPVRFGGDTTAILADNAPDATHVGYVEGYVLASETESGLFWHATLDQPTVWSDLDVFAADSQPDHIEALVVTAFREVILGGRKSIEQYERLGTGEIPFFRRWAMGEGMRGAYTMIFADNSIWYVNHLGEFMRSSGQVPSDQSGDIALKLEEVDSWAEAWTARLHAGGQKFIVLQLPHATNGYGTKGVTYLLDYRNKRWSQLFGWDDGEGVPTRWPGWSAHSLWGRWFVGGNGVVYEVDPDTYTNGGQRARVLGRTAHISNFGEIEVANVRLRLRRGDENSNNAAPVIGVRARRDDRDWTRFRFKSLGRFGERDPVIEFGGMGQGHAFQFEYMVADAAPVEVVSMDIDVRPLAD